MFKFKGLFTRKENEPEQLTYRQLNVRVDGGPESLDENSRSVDIVLATEAPALVFDTNRWEVVTEVLVMDGCEIPAKRQVPMLDVHSKYSTSTVLGSIRGLAVAGDTLTGRAHFSSAQSVEEIWTKVREGHLTDFSAGYKPIESQWIGEGESYKYKGRTYEGPMLLTKRWKIREGSVVPIGADEMATARTANHNSTKEVKGMDKKTRDFLLKRGLITEESTDEEAYAALAKLGERSEPDGGDPGAGKKPEPVDVEKIRAEAQGEERERVNGIIALGDEYNVRHITDPLLVNKGRSISVDEARVIVAKHMMDEAKRHAPSNPHPGKVLADDGDKFRAAATDGLIMRSSLFDEGRVRFDNDKPAPGAYDLRGFSLRELARESLRIAGQPTGGHVVEMVGRALTTSDLPKILANVAHKALFVGWDTAPETWQTWCATGSVEDFKTHYMPRGSEMSDLDEIPEHGEYQYGKMTEAQESYSVATYGKLFAVTRQTIINDDLGALTRIPAGHGEAAARKVGDVVYAVLTGNPTMGDSLALFEATYHKNYVASGSGAAPGISTIAAAILAMGTQKDLQGLRRLNIRPEYFIAPRALEGAAEVFFNSMQFSDHSTVATDSSFASTRKNPYSGSYFTRVYESRLDDAVATAWFLAAMKGKTVTAFFLGGIKKPYTEQRTGWTVDGTEFKVRIDCGAKAVDYRGLYENYGA